MSISSVCLIAKDEERAILEWLAYQKLIGFNRVMVYDNDSSDRTAWIVGRACANDPSISYKPWPNRPGLRPQPTAYADGLAICETDWIAFFDTDEFLVLENHATVNEYLGSFAPTVGGIAVNWLVFGSGGRTEAGDGLVLERFTRCAPSAHGKNLFCKSIVRRKCAAEVRVHTADLSQGNYVDTEGAVLRISSGAAKTPKVNHCGAHLNHYLLKSREEFTLKRSRGHASRSLEDVAKIHIDEEFWNSHDLNSAEDHVIQSHLGALRAEMARLSA